MVPAQSANPLKLRLDRYHEAKRLAPNVERPVTPSHWFAMHYPFHAERYGCPFLEAVEMIGGVKCTTLVSLNIDFFAAILGGDRVINHHVVYVSGEGRFYFKDADAVFKPTTEAKLKTLISMLLVRCAEEMPVTVDKAKLFMDFREEKLLSLIIVKARSMLAADSTFFSINSANQRVEGPETIDRTALAFVGTVTTTSDTTLTLKQVVEAFVVYCEQNGVELVKRPLLKQKVIEAVNNHHGVRLRHDIVGEQGKHTNGWKGLTLTQRLGLGGMNTDKPDPPVDPTNSNSEKPLFSGAVSNLAK